MKKDFTAIVETPKLRSRKTCRLCSSKELLPALSIRKSPIGDDYVSKNRLHEEQELYPLDIFLCAGCGHIQHTEFVDPGALFLNYTFKTQSSPGLIEHFKSYAQDVNRFARCKPGSLVVEIGSNDGSLLKIFQEMQFHVLGIDPAITISENATAEGVETLPKFFSQQLAEEIKRDRGAASIICANNVYAHIDDMDDVTSGVKTLLSSEGVFVFEVSYLVDTITKFAFDTIYHEHVSYHAVHPLAQFFNRHQLELVHVERIAPKGGSIRGYVMHRGARAPSPAVQELIALEHSLQLFSVPTYQTFARQLDEKRLQILEILDSFKSNGAVIAGIGASTTVTTLLYHFELQPYIQFLLDDNPHKEGLYSPGYHLPIFHSKVLYEKKPECVIVLAWVHWDRIRQRHDAYLRAGGTFVVPLPEVKKFP